MTISWDNEAATRAIGAQRITSRSVLVCQGELKILSKIHQINLDIINNLDIVESEAMRRWMSWRAVKY